jgi:hypothetical protein
MMGTFASTLYFNTEKVTVLCDFSDDVMIVVHVPAKLIFRG